MERNAARCDEIKLSCVKHAFLKEVDFVKNNLTGPSNFLDQNVINEKIEKEFQTDFAFSYED